MRYCAEITTIGAPQQGRMFVIYENCASDAQALSAVQSITNLRHDQRHHVDLYRDAGEPGERLIWRGLHKVQAIRPNLKVIGGGA